MNSEDVPTQLRNLMISMPASLAQGDEALEDAGTKLKAILDQCTEHDLGTDDLCLLHMAMNSVNSMVRHPNFAPAIARGMAKAAATHAGKH